MTSETKWTPRKGDVVWTARFGWVNEAVETGSVTIKSASDKQITLAKMESAFGYSTRLDPSCAGTFIHPTEIDAVARLVAQTEAEVEAAQKRLAVARAALAKIRGETP